MAGMAVLARFLSILPLNGRATQNEDADSRDTEIPRMKKLLAVLVLIVHAAAALAEPPQTLLQMAGAQAAPAHLSNGVLIVIDAQREYVDGALPLAGVRSALIESAKLLARARAAGTPVVHVVHHGGGKLFSPDGRFFAIVDSMKPAPGEIVIEKRLPNAFAGTRLDRVLAATHRNHLIVIGFMTHMCVSATVRAALDRGYTTTVVASATATRDLPDGRGGTIPAAEIERASLAALADRFATVVKDESDIPE
jgi:nicotinamidase-related amidase